MRAAFVAALALLALGVGPLWAASADAPRAISQQDALAVFPILDGLNQPLFATHAADGSGRLFVVEKPGTIRVIVGGRLRAAPFLDVRPLVQSFGYEQGLLGLAFHPRSSENGRFFITYTGLDGTNTLAEYRVSADPNLADPSSGRVLFAVPDPFENHNGGMLAFGRDGFLYVGMGDGGDIGDPHDNAQNRRSLLGKILRLDVDSGTPYAIPPGNPFAGRVDARGEIWAYGLRNPWRFSFDRVSGDLYIGDVGQTAYEELNLQSAGSPGVENYGWDVMEGLHCYPRERDCDRDGLKRPLIEYSHDVGCSITGGYVYRGQSMAALFGSYLYGDFCEGFIWSVREGERGAWEPVLLLDTDIQISSFGEDEAGELYLVDLGGRLYRLAHPTAPPTQILPPLTDDAATPTLVPATASPTSPPPTATETETATPTETASPTATVETPTSSPTPTAELATATSTETPTRTPTVTPTVASTVTPTASPTETPPTPSQTPPSTHASPAASPPTAPPPLVKAVVAPAAATESACPASPTQRQPLPTRCSFQMRSPSFWVVGEPSLEVAGWEPLTAFAPQPEPGPRSRFGVVMVSRGDRPWTGANDPTAIVLDSQPCAIDGISGDLCVQQVIQRTAPDGQVEFWLRTSFVKHGFNWLIDWTAPADLYPSWEPIFLELTASFHTDFGAPPPGP